MWASSSELLEAFHSIPQPPVHIFSDPDLSLNDLKAESFDETLAKKMNEMIPKWIKLDEKYLIGQKRKINTGKLPGSVYLALPTGANLWKIEASFPLSHPRVSEDQQDEYFHQLGELFESIPRQKPNISPLHSLSLAKLKQVLDGDSHAATKITGFYNPPDAKSESTASHTISKSKYLSPPNVSQETIFTLSLHSSYDCPSHPDEILQEEFQLLGSNTLKHLKDVVYCVNGLIDQPIVEDSSHTNQQNQPTSPPFFLESCFFIEGIFYVDEDELPEGMSLASLQSELTDTSTLRLIRGYEWFAKIYKSYFQKTWDSICSPPHANSMESFMKSRYKFHQENFADPKLCSFPPIRSMNTTTLSTLRVRLGLRYLYCHMKQICEHFLYFSDLRLFNTTTDYQQLTHSSSRRVQSQNIHETYPRLNYMAKFPRKKCEICLLWSAQYVVYGDRLAANNPTLFCQHCHHMLHYTNEGELLYDDFSVFPYLHDMK